MWQVLLGIIPRIRAFGTYVNGCLVLAILIGGCGADYNALQIIQQNTDAGKILQNIAGTGEQLVAAGRIDLHRSYQMPDKVTIDVWVLLAKGGAKAKNLPDGRSPQARGTVVVLHGLTESKALFPYFGVAERLRTRGYDVVLLDLRAHGRSGGKYITYGAIEKTDVKTVVDKLIAEGEIHQPIYAFGATLGGATAIQYAGIDPRCKGVMAMTPYKDARSIARSRLPLLRSDDFDAALQRASQLAKFDPDEASSVKVARELTNTPLLLVHGILDLTVPSEHSQAIFDAAAGPKKLILKPILDFALIEDWIAEKIDSLATEGLGNDQK